MVGIPTNLLHYKGSKSSIAYAETKSGNQPARDELAQHAKDNPEDAAAAHHLLRILADKGSVSIPGKIKSLKRGGLFELKPSKHLRVFLYSEKGVWFLTSCCWKRAQRAMQKDIKRAITIMKNTKKEYPNVRHQ